jgi:hypothetical protein
MARSIELKFKSTRKDQANVMRLFHAMSGGKYTLDECDECEGIRSRSDGKPVIKTAQCICVAEATP